MTTILEQNNQAVKDALDRFKFIVKESDYSDFDRIFKNLCKDYILSYIGEFEHTIKQIEKKIENYIETKELKLSMDINKAYRASLVYIMNNKEKKAQKYISKFFNHSIAILEIANSNSVRVESHNTEEGQKDFKIKNEGQQMALQQKYKQDYEMVSLFYKVKFKKEFEMIDVKESTKLSMEENMEDLIKWKKNMMKVCFQVKLFANMENKVLEEYAKKLEEKKETCDLCDRPPKHSFLKGMSTPPYTEKGLCCDIHLEELKNRSKKVFHINPNDMVNLEKEVLN